jgi:PPE-repeat protein
MDFTFLPPEVNSARMYSGPGSGSLLAAAAGWDSLAVELSTTADGYESVISSLTSLDWRGPAAAAMAATAAPYVGWLRTMAQQTKQAASQAWAAAAAYEQAWMMTVPPATVRANRTRLTALIATNMVGQNTAAIAATEAQYSEFWAQDTAAMSGYEASSSSAARQLTPFSAPDQTTTEDAQAVQGAAVAQAVANDSEEEAATDTPAINQDFKLLDGILATFGAINSTYNVEGFATGIIGAQSNLASLPLSAAAAIPAAIPAALSEATVSATVGGGAGLGNVSATLARAGSVGSMSVPASWSPPPSTAVTAIEPLGMTTIPGTEEVAASGYPGYPGIPAGAAAKGAVPAPRYGARLTVMSRPLVGG